jgi:hypothetical protein
MYDNNKINTGRHGVPGKYRHKDLHKRISWHPRDPTGAAGMLSLAARILVCFFSPVFSVLPFVPLLPLPRAIYRVFFSPGRAEVLFIKGALDSAGADEVCEFEVQEGPMSVTSATEERERKKEKKKRQTRPCEGVCMSAADLTEALLNVRSRFDGDRVCQALQRSQLLGAVRWIRPIKIKAERNPDVGPGPVS